MSMYGGGAKEELYQQARYVQQEYELSEARLVQLLVEIAADYARWAAEKAEGGA